MRGQQNIVVTIILILAVLAVLAGVISWFRIQTEATQGNATVQWDKINKELSTTP